MPTVQQSISSRTVSNTDSSLAQQALLSVFRGRLQDKRDGDTAIERCEVFVQDEADKTECRLVVKMICRHGKGA